MNNQQKNNNNSTLLFHDYETWGVNPKLDFPVQFAAIRTDEHLDIIGEPINFYCQIANDYLPNPHAALVTGITPQKSLNVGLLETQFAEKIFSIMSTPSTCVVGYNSLNFDDEVTRNLFYRNFLPVYDREFLHQNSRWDIIDLVRATYVLRPDSLEWCYNEEDLPSFKLELLANINDIKHESAHDALSDVYATIALAKKIKSNEPRLFDYYFSLRNKHEVARRIDLNTLAPILYISGVISSRQGCATWILPICYHPENKNFMVALDLSKPLDPLMNEAPEDILKFQYSAGKSLEKSGLLNVKLNKCPFIAPAKMLNPKRAEEIGLDRELCLRNFQQIQQSSQLLEKIKLAYQHIPEIERSTDNVDEMLYARDFPSVEDKKNMSVVRGSAEPRYSELLPLFEDIFYQRQLFRFIGRNYPSNFDEHDLKRWQEFRRERISKGLGCIGLEEYLSLIESLAQTNANHPKKVEILRSLYDYAQHI